MINIDFEFMLYVLLLFNLNLRNYNNEENVSA
jgi:hypothetical protein